MLKSKALFAGILLVCAGPAWAAEDPIEAKIHQAAVRITASEHRSIASEKSKPQKKTQEVAAAQAPASATPTIVAGSSQREPAKIVVHVAENHSKHIPHPPVKRHTPTPGPSHR